MKQNDITRLYQRMTPKSKKLFEQAQTTMKPPVTHTSKLDLRPYPFYVKEAKGSRLHDIDGNEYTDYWMGHGGVFLGHNNPHVSQAVIKKIREMGSQCGMPHESEVKLARKIIDMLPCAESVAFTTSGTESAMYAIRIVRAHTKNKKIVKFQGHFHGFTDQLHTGFRPPFDKPWTAGLPDEIFRNTLSIPFNDLQTFEKTIKENKLAGVIMEVVCGTGGGISADRNFLKAVRELTSENAVPLIFDEVITGFRLAPGGAQEYYGVTPDLTTLGKIVGGGYPASGAIAGKNEIMEALNPCGKERWEYVSKAGTFAGNPVTAAAGLATLEMIDNAEGAMNRKANYLGDLARSELNDLFQKSGEKAQVIGVGSIMGIHFTDKSIKTIVEVASADRDKLSLYHHWLTTQGIFFLPTHCGYVSTAHTTEDIGKLVEHTEKYLARGD